MFGLNDLANQAQGLGPQIVGGYANVQRQDLTIAEALDAEVHRRREALQSLLDLRAKLHPDLLKLRRSEIGQLLSF